MTEPVLTSLSGGAPQLSWVLPVFRTSGQLDELLARIHEVSADLVESYEIIVVDDACPEGTGAMAETIAAVDPHLRVLRLPTNRGQDSALRAGLRLSRGDWAVILDADLQDPPEAVRELWSLCTTAVDAVFARRMGSYASPGRLMTSRVYRVAVEYLGGLPRGACLFAVLARALVASMDTATETDVSLLAQIAATRARFVGVSIMRSPRPTGTSAYSSWDRCAKAGRSLWQMLVARRLRKAPSTLERAMTSKPSTSTHTAALDAQISYYAERRPVRMLALDTPYIRRHFREVMNAAGLESGDSVCEWGSGLGRFSRLLLAAGLKVSAIELSPQQAEESRKALAGKGPFSVHCGDIADVLETGLGSFDAMLGFFVLHHLPELQRYLRSAYEALRPGGRIVFVEPNPFNPLFVVQIGLTPGMKWHAERGIYRLTPGAVRRAAAAAGFSRIEIRRYGALPRAPYNWAARWHIERSAEGFLPGVVKPFQTIVAWR